MRTCRTGWTARSAGCCPRRRPRWRATRRSSRGGGSARTRRGGGWRRRPPVIERQKAELAGRETELRARRDEFARVMAELERERVEKGELVAAVDEMLALQADMGAGAHGASPAVVAAAAAESAGRAGGDYAQERRAGGRGRRGCARPGFGFGAQAGGSRIGMPSGLAKPGAGGEEQDDEQY